MPLVPGGKPQSLHGPQGFGGPIDLKILGSSNFCPQPVPPDIVGSKASIVKLENYNVQDSNA